MKKRKRDSSGPPDRREKGRPAKAAAGATGNSDGIEIRMKPQPVALAVLLLMFVAWIGLLLLIYFRTDDHPETDHPAAADAASWALRTPVEWEASG